jgi:predicted HicB family RNase H-like nuclease
VSRKVSSIRIDAELWRQVKVEAAASGMKISEVVEEAIREWLKTRGRSL